jgi:hypothetical protein
MLSVIKLSVLILSDIMSSDIILNVVKLRVIMQNAIMLCINRLRVIMMSVIILRDTEQSVIILNAVVLNVVAPLRNYAHGLHQLHLPEFEASKLKLNIYKAIPGKSYRGEGSVQLTSLC